MTKRWRAAAGLMSLAALATSGFVLTATPAGATTVSTEAQLRAAFVDVNETSIVLANDITLTDCSGTGQDIERSSATALTLDGAGHTLRLDCPGSGSRVITQISSGALTFENVTITGGEKTAGAGGGVFSAGSVTVRNSTITGNSAVTGGGIFSTGSTGATVINSTITGNQATSTGGGVTALDVTLVYATIAGNTAPTGANIEIIAFDSLTSFGSVVALPLGGGENCNFQPVPVTISNGFNFSDDASCGFTGTGDRENAGDPGLGPLASNGGPTQTMLPQTGSPLIDGVPTASCQADGASGITTDQRGVTRPQLGGCDIGAVEVEAPPPPPPPPPPPVPVVVTPTFTG